MAATRHNDALTNQSLKCRVKRRLAVSINMHAELTPLRDELDRLDAALVQILASRFSICRHIAEVKSAQALPMMQTDRVQIVKGRVAELAEQQGISGDFIQQLYEMIIGEACRIEQEILEQDVSR